MRYRRDVVAVACPTCEQPVGRMCITIDVESRAVGHEIVRCHAARFRAYRAAVIAAFASNVDAPMPVTPKAKPEPEPKSCARCGSDEHRQCCVMCGCRIYKRHRGRYVPPQFCSPSCLDSHELAQVRATRVVSAPSSS